MPNAARLTLPRPQLLSYGWVATAANVGTVALTLPTPVLVNGGGHTLALTLPLMEISVRGAAGGSAQAALTAPAPTMSATGLTGRVGAVVMALPAPVLATNGPAGIRLAIPRPTLMGAGVTGVLGEARIGVSRPVLTAVGTTEYAGAAALTLRPQLEARGVSGGAARTALTLRALALAARGSTGVVGGAQLTLPVVRLSAQGLREAVGAATLTLPMLHLQSTGHAAGSGAHEAYVMHLEAQALTQYTNYAFNSMTQFNGVYLGASDDGIFALAGASDAGVAIDAVARVGVSDFGTSLLKRVLKAYVGYRADGDLELRITTDELTTRSYRLHPTSAGMHGGAVKIGKGVHARYWQFEVANIDGADFTLNCVEITPNRLGRRVNESGA